MRTIPGYTLQTAHAKGHLRLPGIPNRKGNELVSAYMLIQQSSRIAAELAAVEARRALLSSTLAALETRLGTIDVAAATRQLQNAPASQQGRKSRARKRPAPEPAEPRRQVFRMGY